MTGTGTTILDNDSFLTINAGDVTLDQRTFTNKGTVNWVAGNILVNNATINNESVFNATANGTIDFTGGASDPRGSFNTTGANGVFQKTAGTGVTKVEIPFNASGTRVAGGVVVGTGTLELQGGGTFSSKMVTAVANTTTLSFQAPTTNETYTFITGADLTGLGNYLVGKTGGFGANFTVAQNATVPVTRLKMDGDAIVTGAGTLEISSRLDWVGGAMKHLGTTTVKNGATAVIGGFPTILLLEQRTFNNLGVTQLTGGNGGDVMLNVNNGATINSSGTFELEDDSDMVQDAGAAKSKFNITGTLKKTSGATGMQQGESEIGVDVKFDTATSKFEPNGFRVNFTGSKVSMLNGTFETMGGEIQVAGLFEQSGGTVTVNGGPLTVTGAYDMSGGTLTANGAASILTVSGGFQQSGGTSTFGGTGGRLSVTGSVTLSGGAVLTMSNGLLDATGTIAIQSGTTLNGYGGIVTGNVTNAGTLNLINGSAPTLLTITGTYAQTGTLKVGLASSSSYSVLSVSGGATLGGTLDVIALNGFTPMPGMTFVPLTYGSRSGSFATVNKPPLGFGVWHDAYGSTSYSLWVAMF